MAEVLKNFVDGERLESKGQRSYEVRNPANNELLALCPESTAEEVDAAVASAKAAFKKWRSTIPTRRAELLYTFRQKMLDAYNELAEMMVYENGKTLEDAKAELTRSLQYVEHPTGIPELLKGEYSEDVGTRVDEHFIREPLGVFVLIPPFNFPAMIPLYFTWAVACGDTVVMKPSEVCPLTVNRLAQLAQESGFPKGVLNLVHGGGQVGARLITHPDVMGVTFVGSSAVAEKVYKMATGQGKRAQCQGGSKNHALVMPDANIAKIMPNLINSCFGNAGQRCFAISNLLVHKDIYTEFKQKFVEAAQKMRLGSGMDPEVTMGPVISKAALDRLVGYIDHAVQEGATLVLDGRNPRVPKYPDGNYLGPTILEAELGMKVFTDDVFGPVRCLKQVSSLEEAIEVIGRNPFGHTAVIYSNNGAWVREFIRGTDVGQIGVNVGTPAPIAFYPVGGRRISFFGSTRGRANDAVDFYTDKKVIATQWIT